MTGPVTAYRRIRPADVYLFDGTNAQAIVDWSAGHAYIAEGQLIIITNRGDVAADIGDTIIRNLRGHYYPCPPDDFEADWRVHP